MAFLQATFQCEVLTPMFLSGTDQKMCELRAASLRGVMRYWYRAALGAQGLNLARVREQEAKVFGSTDSGSPVSVRITAPDGLGIPKNPAYLPDWDPKKTKRKASDNLDMGKFGTPTKYLWYTTRLAEHKPDGNRRVYVEPETVFHVRFSAVVSGKPERQAAVRTAFAETIKAFWLVSHLGSLGTRARRLAGSFDAWLSASEGLDGLALPTFRVDAGGETDGYLRETMRSVVSPVRSLAGPPPFSTLHPDWAKVWRLGLEADSWEEAVWQFADCFRMFRLRRQPDYDAMKEAILADVRPQTVERASFGLPLMFAMRRRPSDDYTRRIVTLQGGGRSGRRASPMWSRLVRLDDGNYDVVVTHFDSRFLPGGLEMGHMQINAPQTSLVPRFIQDKFPHASSLL